MKLIDLLSEAAGDIFEDQWVAALQKQYAFVHKAFTHQPGACRGCWDVRGVDIFYSNSKPAGDRNADYTDRDDATGREILIPQNARMLQVKSSLPGALSHVFQWHNRASKGSQDNFRAVVVGSPPKNLNMAEIEGPGYYIPERQSSEMPSDMKELESLMSTLGEVAQNKRAPLSGSELRQLRDKILSFDPSRANFYADSLKPPAETSDERRVRERADAEEKQRREAYLETLKTELVQSLPQLDQFFKDQMTEASRYMASGRKGDSKVDAAINATMQKFRNGLGQVRTRLSRSELLQIQQFEEHAKEYRVKLSDKLMGRRRKAASGTRQQRHPFKARSISGRPMLSRGANPTYQCVYADSGGKPCNNIPTHKSHINEPHKFQPYKAEGKRIVICRQCCLSKAQCAKRQPTTESFETKLVFALYD